MCACACVYSEKHCVLFDDAVSLSRGVWYVACGRYVCVVYVHVCVRVCVCSEKHCVLFDDAVSLSRGVWYVAWARIAGPSSDCGSSGHTSVTTDHQSEQLFVVIIINVFV